MELSKLAPPDLADVKRFEDNNATVAAFVSGQVQFLATGASVAGGGDGKSNPQLNTELKFVLKDSPNFIGVAKGEDALRTEGQRDHCRQPKPPVSWKSDRHEVAGPPGGRICRNKPASARLHGVLRAVRHPDPALGASVTMIELDFWPALLREWPQLLRGLGLTVALTAISAVLGV